MIVTKNTYGITSVFRYKSIDAPPIGAVKGSSLDRSEEQTEEAFIKRLINKSLLPEKEEKKPPSPRTMSRRTKSKIRKKIMAFARIHKHLTFLTLTFVNKIEDQSAVKILHSFLDNVAKRSKSFQYLWVAEKQTENKVFENNIHFHLITNKYWKIGKWWPYWIELQAKKGIVPRDENFRPSSAFDVRAINGNNVKAIANYLTHYVTKNEGQFLCQIWNCSKKISKLYTSFYEDIGFIKKVEALEKKNLLGGERKVYTQEYCAVHMIPLNRITLNLYGKIDKRNKEVWSGDR
jgi:hypothetical protein